MQAKAAAAENIPEDFYCSAHREESVTDAEYAAAAPEDAEGADTSSFPASEPVLITNVLKKRKA